ncbi:unnamed protein product [Porites lobata]|uniref:Integrin alpha FG-GAP repeat containing 2 n=1 Tax=Porites lobata TaxID=104759 RepID=A0ABN8Q327_9CNID|nr:unnamed protein product [Porites lobata]
MKETMNPNTRCVSFVENLQLEISDSLFNESILLADVDNDDDYELVVGQINGDLLIFKGSSQKPWRTCRKLGMITCVGVGDLWNQGENLLFCITAEGWCHMFYIRTCSSEDSLEPVSSQLLPSNCKVVLLADVDGDGSLKLITGHADRVVHVHKLQADQNTEAGVQEKLLTETEEDKKNVNSATLASSSSQSSRQDSSKDNTKEKMERKNSKQEEKVSLVDNKNGKEQISVKGGSEKPCAFGWHFVSLKSWTVSYQINSLVVFDVMKTRYLLASQPGGTYVILMSSALNQQEAPEEKISCSPSSSILNQLPVVWGRNKGIPTNLITLKCHDSAATELANSTLTDQAPSYLVLCNQDGQLVFMSANKNHSWSMRVDQGNYKLFALSKLDITKDGNEEVAICSWDGVTYFVDYLRNVVQFKFGENVLAFCAGYYAYNAGKNLSALVYVTSFNRIVVYWNARLSAMVPTNSGIKMKRKFKEQRIENCC